MTLDALIRPPDDGETLAADVATFHADLQRVLNDTDDLNARLDDIVSRRAALAAELADRPTLEADIDEMLELTRGLFKSGRAGRWSIRMRTRGEPHRGPLVQACQRAPGGHRPQRPRPPLARPVD